MRLSNLEIKGFKSFADKTLISFDSNITGIVGPNGCGKSNVVDAIRWVLGEQKTSSLRLEKMENIIFNGTKKRKASGLAEVTLTFENTRNTLPTEFTTVNVSRILYRDGESAYKLNGVPCRLKDITNLFLDTGIGSDSYAIIELKMIDEILHDRDNSRRKLFEQAAGISKYKQRKKETLLKLNATDADLNRVEDLLFEIEGNLKTLEKQAKKAIKYRALKEDYKTWSLNCTVVELDSVKTTYKEIEKQINAEKTKLTETEAKIAELNSKIESEKMRLLEQEKQLSQAQKQVNEINQVISKLENERNMKRQELNFLTEKKSQLQLQLTENGPKNEQLQKDISNLSEFLATAQAEATELQKEVENLQQKNLQLEQQRNTSDGQLKKLLTEKQHLEQQVFHAEKNLAVTESRYQTLEINFKQAGEEQKHKTAVLEELETSFGKVNKTLNNQKSVIAGLEKQKQEYEQQKANFIQQREQLKEKLISIERKSDARKNEYKLVKSLVDNMEGFPESIRYLRKSTDWMKDFPLLSDIIYSENAYRPAIESFLEPYLNYFIVPDWSTAQKAVELLKNSAKGRANFFILSAFETQKKAAPEIDGLLAVKDLIETDVKFKPVIDFLFENVYITTDVEAKIPQNIPAGTMVLDKEGSWVRGGRQLSGGSVGLFEGKRIGRAKSLEKLKSEIEKLDKESWDVKGEIDRLAEKEAGFEQNNPEAALQQANQQLQVIEKELSILTERKEQTLKTIEESKQKHTGITDEITKLEAERGKLFETLKTNKSALEKLSVELIQHQEQHTQNQEQLQQQKQHFNDINLKYHQKVNKVESLEKEIQLKKEQVDALEQSAAHAERELKAAGEKQEVISGRLKGIEEELLTAYQQKEQQEKNLTDDENLFFKAKGEVQQQEKLLTQHRETHRSSEQLMHSLNEKVTDFKIRLSGIKERLQVEFKTDINDLINLDPDPEWREDDLREKVEQFKRRIENFGEVNPMALEAYNEMKERFDFITVQRKDLLDAKESLTSTINEIENTAKEKFLDAFHKVRENFIMVFRSLFTEEDNCDLTLSDPDNPLESGILIFAQPKGKRPQVVDQLSGGEKALTALSLLFSLYLLKPAPFCILDEVDAPLDDANIEKFNKTIRDFSQQSQFILVTHNKMTMSSVDMIYGVTMAEQGVSKVVPVDFGDLKVA